MPLMFTASEVCKYFYCPRELYFRNVQHIKPNRTYKMKRGQQKHEELIRKKTADITSEVQYYYNVYLKDDGLKLIALLDCLETNGDWGIPIDLKTGKCYYKKIKKHHYAQLLIQAILVEMQMGLSVSSVKVHYLDENEIIESRITISDKIWILNEIEKLKKYLEMEILPEPTPDTNKCNDCEYWKYCYGV
ncbi:MAG: CRISPR-associated protein Cas4 [Promethearchaeota archaeon]|nr:MAG: CRISPR-associated protein Cas4 [Candidatus Lokiarchaeota archaeon]